ncbi:MAG: hypothetical protein PHD43_02945 [Methylococcales bacterium]|nr:hypothetical protein [Methylococcales bacterium]
MMTIDETFDIGIDTRTAVDNLAYEFTFRFTGAIDKPNYKLGPEQLAAENQKKAAAVVAKARD